MHAIIDRFFETLHAGLAKIEWVPTDQDIERHEHSFAYHRAGDIEYDLTAYPDETRDGVAIYATVGVTHLELSRLGSEFIGLPPDRTSAFGRTLADLVRERGSPATPYSRWFVRSIDDVGSVAELLCQDVVDHAYPYLFSFSTLDDVIHRLRSERSQVGVGNLAIAAALAGRQSEALDALASYAAEAATQRPPLSIQSWRFVRSFVAHFKIPQSELPFGIPP
jgi:hypothetical protein